MSTATDTLTQRQRAAAQRFADVLCAGMGRDTDVRGLLLAEVAETLRRRDQFHTARLLQQAADIYEGKA